MTKENLVDKFHSLNFKIMQEKETPSMFEEFEDLTRVCEIIKKQFQAIINYENFEYQPLGEVGDIVKGFKDIDFSFSFTIEAHLHAINAIHEISEDMQILFFSYFLDSKNISTKTLLKNTFKKAKEAIAILELIQRDIENTTPQIPNIQGDIRNLLEKATQKT